MDKMSVEKLDAINELMKELAKGEKSAEENGWLSNDDVKTIIK